MLLVLTVRFRKNSSSLKLGAQISVSSQLDENTFEKERNKNKKKIRHTDILSNRGTSVLVL